MKLKNLVKAFCVTLGILCFVTCSDNEVIPLVHTQLPAPDNIMYKATQTTLHFEWTNVTGATSYEVSLAKEEFPEDEDVIETSNNYCDFTGLEAATTYVFSMRSCGSGGLYSEYIEGTAVTKEHSKLNTPTGLTVSNIFNVGATISWNVVTDAVSYRVVVKNTSTSATACNDVVFETTFEVSGLTASTSYTVTVKALVGNGSEESEYDSDEASATFETNNYALLTAPTLKVAHKSHALAILEWELSSTALAEQSVGSSDTYNFRLCDANGNTLREVDGYASFNFTRYPSYRIVWGGLTGNTTYKLEAQRVSTENTKTYLDSEWASVTVTTDVAPDTSGYLLYWDFDNVPFDACAMYAAYGFTRPTGDVGWTDPDKVPISAPSSDKTTVYAQTLTQDLGQSFCDAYFPGISVSDIINPSDGATYSAGSTHNVIAVAGHSKFGASSRPAWISLPAFSSLSSGSSVYLEVDACPYAEPSTSGNWLAPTNSDTGEYFYVWAPGAKIESVEGETSSSATIDSKDAGLVKLKNVLVNSSEFKNGSEDPYRYTSHKVKISGVGPDTRIVIYTALDNDGKQHRMWMDNVKVSRAD